MNVSKEIKRYIVHYLAGGKNVSSRDPRRAFINLLGEDGKSVGFLNFYRNPESMPDKDRYDPTFGAQLYYSWQDFPQVIDLLRNEKPIYLRYFETSIAGDLLVGVEPEPVGEGEDDVLPR